MPDEERYVMIKEPETRPDYAGVTIYDRLSRRIGDEYRPGSTNYSLEVGWQVLDRLRFGEVHWHDINWLRTTHVNPNNLEVVERAG